MRDYFIRRFLLIIPTLIGATLVVFGITRITPGGPYERAMQAALMGDHGGGGKNAGGSLSEEQKEEMAAYYGFDQPFFPRLSRVAGPFAKRRRQAVHQIPKGPTGDARDAARVAPA